MLLLNVCVEGSIAEIGFATRALKIPGLAFEAIFLRRLRVHIIKYIMDNAGRKIDFN